MWQRLSLSHDSLFYSLSLFYSRSSLSPFLSLSLWQPSPPGPLALFLSPSLSLLRLSLFFQLLSFPLFFTFSGHPLPESLPCLLPLPLALVIVGISLRPPTPSLSGKQFKHIKSHGAHQLVREGRDGAVDGGEEVPEEVPEEVLQVNMHLRHDWLRARALTLVSTSCSLF